MLLGEAASKCEHIAGVPLQPAVAEKLHRLYLAKGVLATTAIEGNSLSEEEVLKHLEGKLKLPQSKEYLAQEIDNIIGVCNMIAEQLKSGNSNLMPDRIREFNKKVLEKLTPGEDVVPGEFRKHPVVVGNIYRGAPAEDCEFLITQLCKWLSGPDFNAPKGMETVYAIIKAIVAHIYIAWIHPFGDGNGRSARLIEFQILLSAGIPTPAAHLLSNHYNQTRTEYYRQLNQASKSKGDIIPFLEYATRGMVDGLHEQLEQIRNQQWDVAWQNYVHELFQDKTGDSNRRRRYLILDLSAKPDSVQISSIREFTPRLVKAYINKTSKTLQRDLRELEKMELIERTRTTVRARKEIILAFLPWRKSDEKEK